MEALRHLDQAKPGIVARAEILYDEHRETIFRRTDRLFAFLLGMEWLGGIAVALVVSPRTWAGTTSQIHLHLWAAVLLGGLIVAFPILLALKRPGSTLTRHTIAIAQMMFAGLLIHLTGGRIETHFIIFGSLAFLAFYRDWPVLISATAVVAIDHLLRGLLLEGVRLLRGRRADRPVERKTLRDRARQVGPDRPEDRGDARLDRHARLLPARRGSEPRRSRDARRG